MSKIYELAKKEEFDFYDLAEIMKILRSDKGCPWDREQTHKSIKVDFIEETYEAIEGIDKDDNTILEEELGDVLLQVIFHSQIADEENAFNVNDVINGICKKLIIRHPHVFGEVTVNDSGEVLKNWDAIKVKEKNQRTFSEELSSISKSLPSLIRAKKINSKLIKKDIPYESENKDVTDTLRLINNKIENKNTKEKNEYFAEFLFSLSALFAREKTDSEVILADRCNEIIKKY